MTNVFDCDSFNRVRTDICSIEIFVQILLMFVHAQKSNMNSIINETAINTFVANKHSSTTNLLNS